jgi:hypothetical protein
MINDWKIMNRRNIKFKAKFSKQAVIVLSKMDRCVLLEGDGVTWKPRLEAFIFVLI